MYILADGSLNHALKTLPLTSQKRTSGTCLAIPGVGLNRNAVNNRKTGHYYLKSYLSDRTDIVTWQDGIKISVSRHHTKN